MRSSTRVPIGTVMTIALAAAGNGAAAAANALSRCLLMVPISRRVSSIAAMTQRSNSRGLAGWPRGAWLQQLRGQGDPEGHRRYGLPCVESPGELERVRWKVEPDAPAAATHEELAVDQLHESAVYRAIAHRVGDGPEAVGDRSSALDVRRCDSDD